MSGGRRFAPSSTAGRVSALRECPARTGEMHCIDDREGTVERRPERLSASENLGRLVRTGASARKLPPSCKRRETLWGAPAMVEELPSVTGDEEGLGGLSEVIATTLTLSKYLSY
jgi:hypothetical protein